MSARYNIIFEDKMTLSVDYFKNNRKLLLWNGSACNYLASNLRLKTAKKIFYYLISKPGKCYTKRTVTIKKVEKK